MISRKKNIAIVASFLIIQVVVAIVVITDAFNNFHGYLSELSVLNSYLYTGTVVVGITILIPFFVADKSLRRNLLFCFPVSIVMWVMMPFLHYLVKENSRNERLELELEEQKKSEQPTTTDSVTKGLGLTDKTDTTANFHIFNPLRTP